MTTTLESETTIQAPIEQAYAYTADPGNWREWYPHTSRIERTARGPVQVGEAWSEHVAAAGLKLRIHWRATVVEPPQHLVIRGEVRSSLLLRPIVHGGRVEITYRFRTDAARTRFTRSLSYEFPNVFGRLLGDVVLNRRIAREFKPAIENLKRAVEARFSAPSSEKRRMSLNG